MLTPFKTLKYATFLNWQPDDEWLELNILTFQAPVSQSAKQTQDGCHLSRSGSQFHSLRRYGGAGSAGQYDSSQHSYCNTYNSLTLGRNNCNAALANSQCKYQYSDKITHKDTEEVQVPLLSPTSASISTEPTISTMSSTVSSSELNNSLTSSDTSEFSAPDRESEVW